MAEQHPIPQQISAYQFRLVGDMTLKQFLQLAGGALVSLLIYAIPVHPFIKWPLIIFSFLMGVALAFLPIEDRPLSTWIFIFFRSIYSPTYFVWRKTDKKRSFYLEEKGFIKKPILKKTPQEELTQTLPKDESIEKLEAKEQTFLEKVSSQFIAPGTSVKITEAANLPHQRKEFPVPEAKKPEIENTESPEAETPVQTIEATFPTSVSPSIGQKSQSPMQAQFSQEVAPPIPPSKPNIIVGQVLDVNGKIVEGAILEIKDENGRPVRALKTNKLGHFMIVTPLTNGKYEILIEKDGLIFNPIVFEAIGEIISPIAIWATNKALDNEKESKESGTVYNN